MTSQKQTTTVDPQGEIHVRMAWSLTMSTLSWKWIEFVANVEQGDAFECLGNCVLCRHNLLYEVKLFIIWFSSVQSLCMSNPLWPHELQHARPPCPSLNPGVHPNPFPLSWWCHPTISSSVVPFSCPPSFPITGSLHFRWPKYWSFSISISPSNEHQGLISFRMDWLGLLAVQGTLKSLLQHHSSKASILQHSAFFF